MKRATGATSIEQDGCKAPRKVASRDMQETAEINANGTSFCTLVLPFISNSRPDGMRERGQVGSE